MKKIILLFAVLIIAAALVVPANARGNDTDLTAYPAELEYYDAQINVMLPRLENFQWQYYAINGRFYQALQSHSLAPDVPQVPDGIHQSPTDQPEDLAYFWTMIAELPSQLSWSFRIDTYSGPDGPGYVVTIETVIDGATWQRIINNGPDTWRAADWFQVGTEF